MVQLLRILSTLLAAHVMSATAGNCFSDQFWGVQRMPVKPFPPGKICPGKPPKGERWACEDPSINFPTVDCLIADIKTCGIISNGHPTILFSFGVGQGNIKKVRDQYNPLGNVYDDMLDNAYWASVMDKKTGSRGEVFRLDIRERLLVFLARSGEAIGAVASGDVLVYIGKRDGHGGLGAFQQDDPEIRRDGPNIFRTYELPALQRNSAVTSIISVDISNNAQHTVDWENGQSAPNLNNPLLPPGSANDMPVPPVPAGFRKSRRDANDTDDDSPIICPVDALADIAAAESTSTSTSERTSSVSTITPPPNVPTPSCILHEQDPDQGITQAFCLCGGTATLSPLSVASTGHQSDSCAYTTIPATAEETVTTLASTYTKNCQACAQVGFNAPSCTKVPQCTPTSAQVTVQAGSSGVHVGTLTGTALYTSVSSALDKLCPTVTQSKSFTSCSTGTVKIPHIQYINSGRLDDNGELEIKVQASSYNSTSLRDAIIKSAALTAQKGSELRNSCSNKTYTVIFERDLLPPSRIWSRRSSLPPTFVRDRPDPIQTQGVFCNTTAFAGVGYFSPEWRQAQNPGAEAYIDATWEFQREAGGDLLCDIVRDFIDDLEIAVAAIAPEFVAGDAALAPDVQAFIDSQCCGGGGE